MKRILISILVLVGVALAAVAYIGSQQAPVISAEVVDLQGLNSDAGFAKADAPRSFTFPLDHGAHPDFQTEWWYYTGNLDTADGRHFGFQLTFFRHAITPTVPARASDWATNQIYFAHFAITDVKGNDHFVSERFSRGAAGLAGASGDPYHVWLENWQATSLSPDGSRVHLQAEDSNHTLDLTLSPDKPLVLEGNQGVSQKSDAPGDASYYYSFTRLATRGTLAINGTTYSVQGLSWMDHEFGTTSLGPNASGWDWFAIQLSDRRELVFFQIRNKDGSVEPFSGGMLVQADGSTTPLAPTQVKLQVLSTWKSKLNANYPSQWSLSVPSANLQLNIKPYVSDQEMRVSIPYWEGAVQITGTSDGNAIRGNGYVEMTGYVLNAAAPVR